MRKALTAKTIEALKPGAKRYDVHDVLCPGLSVRVGQGGQKTFTVKYRYGLIQRRLRLGVHPRITLAQAREKALAALRAVDEGIVWTGVQKGPRYGGDRRLKGTPISMV